MFVLITLLFQRQNEPLNAQTEEYSFGLASRNQLQYQPTSAITYKNITITIRKINDKTYIHKILMYS